MKLQKISEIRSQISASVHNDTIKAIVKLSDNERRHFSRMVDILLAEAIEARKSIKNN